MKINTTRFGEINVPGVCIVRFENGLPGFARLKKYALIPYAEESPFYILQSVSNPDLTLLLVDPYRFFNDYVFELEDGFAARYGFTADNQPHVFSVVTLRDEIGNATANMAAPILVNWTTQTAVQLVLENSSYSLRQKLFPEGLPDQKQPKQTKSSKQQARKQHLTSQYPQHMEAI